MKEQLENELKIWEEEYLKAKEKLEKEHPYIVNQLNDHHPVNELNKKYFEKKRKIIEKYKAPEK